eukprot:gnl/MRDRNA2_/MRDRNA2_18107_c0_seq1.p1 gnl/MRDRNA2_/MRDRNA2_18107_c0~~gnl/MRDRNA2_/MRDRNA2_18107_c0_seq1.p1  ORF type:complete len:265 (+),score=29.67 gnl/MRDRNA2_/MRDRNA2_18107_c0_seq1:71-865(+)
MSDSEIVVDSPSSPQRRKCKSISARILEGDHSTSSRPSQMVNVTRSVPCNPNMSLAKGLGALKGSSAKAMRTAMAARVSQSQANAQVCKTEIWPKSSDHPPPSSWYDVKEVLSDLTHVEPLPGHEHETDDFLSEARARKAIGEPYPIRVAPEGHCGPVMAGASITGTHLRREWVAWKREKIRLDRILSDAVTANAGAAGASRCRNLALPPLGDATCYPPRAAEPSWGSPAVPSYKMELPKTACPPRGTDGHWSAVHHGFPREAL